MGHGQFSRRVGWQAFQVRTQQKPRPRGDKTQGQVLRRETHPLAAIALAVSSQLGSNVSCTGCFLPFQGQTSSEAPGWGGLSSNSSQLAHPLHTCLPPPVHPVTSALAARAHLALSPIVCIPRPISGHSHPPHTPGSLSTSGSFPSIQP